MVPSGTDPGSARWRDEVAPSPSRLAVQAIAVLWCGVLAIAQIEGSLAPEMRWRAGRAPVGGLLLATLMLIAPLGHDRHIAPSAGGRARSAGGSPMPSTS